MNSKIMGKKWFLSGKGGKKKLKATNSGSLSPYGLNFKNAITNYLGFRNRLKARKVQLPSVNIISQEISTVNKDCLNISIEQKCGKCGLIYTKTIIKPVGTKKVLYNFRCSKCGSQKKLYLKLKLRALSKIQLEISKENNNNHFNKGVNTFSIVNQESTVVLENNKDEKIKIRFNLSSPTPKIIRPDINGIRTIDLNSPLAIAIIGKKKGEPVEVNNISYTIIGIE